MNYPVWELAFGGGMLIAIVAILHLFVAHFAIGGGLWLVVTEMRARRRQDEQLLAYVKSHTRFFMLLTLVFGAISGVGIWFTIGLVSPTTVSALIHAYVWGWAMEWVCFFVEIAAALVYYYGWDKLSPKTHVAVGWIYFVAAWMSLAIINGIITFMLTPGNWLETHSFWAGFFNPTYWPSLFVRTFAGWGTAGILTLLTAAVLPRGEFRNRVIRYSASWVVVAAILGGLAGLWYKSAIPGWSDLVLGSVPILPVMLTWLKIGLVSSLILALWPLLVPKTWHPVGVVLIVLSGLLVFASGEWVRETGRKPFTIHGYLYSNGMLVSQEETLATDGVLAHTRWIDPAARTDKTALGQQIYRAHCQPCHTMDGYNGLRPFLAHWSEETIASLLPRLQYVRALMPPWFGNEYENECLTQYLLSESATGAATFPPHAEAAQQLAWDISCGVCHTLDRFRPLRDSLAGYSREDLEDLLDSVGELTDEMPAYYGDDQQRELLLEYLEQAAGSEPTTVAVAEGGTP